MADILEINGGITNSDIDIDDSTPLVQKTYSSDKIEELLDDKANKSNWVAWDILINDWDGNPISSGKALWNYATYNHSHNSTEIVLNTNNFSWVLPKTINTIQKLADFIDDEVWLGRSLEFDWSWSSLWVRQEWASSFTYVDITGEEWKWLEFKWNWTKLWVRAEWDANYVYTELVGQSTNWEDWEDWKDIEFVWAWTKLWVKREGDISFLYRELIWPPWISWWAGTDWAYAYDLHTSENGQTIFDLTFEYESWKNNLLVFVNWNKQTVTVDYTETDDETVTFLDWLESADRVEFYYLNKWVNWKGTYSPTKEYKIDNAVSFSWSSYILENEAPAWTLPTDENYWGLLAWQWEQWSATANEVKDRIISSNWQTLFTVPQYISWWIEIYINWMVQINGDDYTETSNTEITLTEALESWDVFYYIIKW